MNYLVKIYDCQGVFEIYGTNVWIGTFDSIPEYISVNGVYYAKLVAALPDRLQYRQIMIRNL